MSFVRSLGLAALLLAVAACSGGSSGSTPSTPNASSTTITVTTSNGAPISQIQVTLSTGITDGEATGPITSNPTNGAGQVLFSNLPAAGQLCVSTATMVGGHLYTASHCAQPFPASYTLKFSSKMPD
jgi:ABC-type glycerol-3-phosphate transport system substrate-binding protein